MVLTPSETPNPTTFLFALPPPPKPSALIAVFLLPGVTLPEGNAAAIYSVTPPTPGQAQPNSKFLGGIGPGKESAVLRVATSGSANIVVGIALEPAESVATRISQLGQGQAPGNQSGALQPLSTALKQQPTTLVLAQRIIKNAFNYLSSFSEKAGPNQVEVVPLKAFEEWWKKFETRIKSDPGFLERDG
jgi:protein Hikeshi